MTEERLTPLLVDVRQAAQILGCGRTFIYGMLQRGDLPAVKLGRLTRVPIAALRALVEDGGAPVGEGAVLATRGRMAVTHAVEDLK